MKGHLVVLDIYVSKCHIFYFFCVTEKYSLLLKIDRYKDVCGLKYSLGLAGLSVFLSLSYSQLCVSSVNIHDTCFNLYFATCE